MCGCERRVSVVVFLMGAFVVFTTGQDACNRETPCTPDEVLPDPEDCRKFYECNNGGNWKRQSCGNNDFDSVTDTCVPVGTGTCFSCDAVEVSTDPACEKLVPCLIGDVLGNPLDCDSYYECTAVFIWTQIQCPTGQTFDTSSMQCERTVTPGIVCQPACPNWSVPNPTTVTTTAAADTTTTTTAGSTIRSTSLTEGIIDSATQEVIDKFHDMMCGIEEYGYCDVSGAYPDPTSCDRFFLCYSNQWKSFPCFGKEFDIMTRACVEGDVTCLPECPELQDTPTMMPTTSTTTPLPTPNPPSTPTTAPTTTPITTPTETPTTTVTTLITTTTSSTTTTTSPDTTSTSATTTQSLIETTLEVEQSTAGSEVVLTTKSNGDDGQQTTLPLLTTAEPDVTTKETTITTKVATTSSAAIEEITEPPRVTTEPMGETTEPAEAETTEPIVDTTEPEVDTTVAEVDTTVAEVDTTVAEVDTTVAEGETTVAEVDTTVAEVDTTVAEVDTTVAEVDTTVAEVDTTVADVDTTIAEEETTEPKVESTAGEEHTTEPFDATTQSLNTHKPVQDVVNSTVSVTTAAGDIRTTDAAEMETTSTPSISTIPMSTTTTTVTTLDTSTADLSTTSPSIITLTTSTTTTTAATTTEITIPPTTSTTTITTIDNDDQTTSQIPSTATTNQRVETAPPVTVISTTSEVVQYCIEEMSAGVLWRATPEGQTDRNACPNSMQGEATRLCTEDENGNPLWQPAYLGLCVDVIYQVVLTQAVRLQDSDTDMPTSTSTVEQVSNLLNTVVDSGTNIAMGMSAGNLNATVETLEVLVNVNQEASLNFIETSVNTTSNILSPNNRPAWEAVVHEDDSRAVVLLNIAEELATGVSEIVEEGDTILLVSPTFVVEVVSVTPEEPSQDLVFSSLAPATDSITIPAETLQQVNAVVQTDEVVIWSTQFSQLSQYLPTKEDEELGSNIIGMTIANLPEGTILDPPIQMTFGLTNTSSLEDKQVECVFWHYTSADRGFWDNAGCKVVSLSAQNIECECNHLTNFAVLISPYVGEDTIHQRILSIIGVVGCLLSILGSLVTLCLYAIAWKRVNSQHAIVMLNLCFVLIIANTLFLVGIEKTDHELACTAIAASLHYLYLVAMMLMLADGIYFVLYIVYVFHTKRKRETMLILFTSWTLPAVEVGLSLSITKLEGYGTPQYCWLARENWVILAFIIPVIIIIVVNFFIFVKVLKTAATSKTTENKNRLLSTLWNVMVILPLLGVTWVFGLLSVNEKTIAFQYVFSICNSLQGFFIFLCHCALNKKVREAVAAKFKSPSSSAASIKSAKSVRSDKSKKSNKSDKSNKKKSKEDKRKMTEKPIKMTPQINGNAGHMTTDSNKVVDETLLDDPAAALVIL